MAVCRYVYERHFDKFKHHRFSIGLCNEETLFGKEAVHVPKKNKRKHRGLMIEKKKTKGTPPTAPVFWEGG